MTKKLKLISGVLFLALMSANIGTIFYESWSQLFTHSQRGWEAKEVDGKPVIWTVDADGPAAAEIWGSEQVERALERICGEETSAENIARRMIEACDGAAGGRSNNDDMTIVVARVRLK